MIRVAFLVLTFFWGGICFSQESLDLSYGQDELKIVSVLGTDVNYLDKGAGPTVVLFHPALDFRY
jgi:hypothetical protein